MIQRLNPTPKPAYPNDLTSARTWLDWAQEHAHQESCLCHQCVIARRLIADDVRRAFDAEDDA